MTKVLNKKTVLLSVIIASSMGVTAMAENLIHTPYVNPTAQNNISSSLVSRGAFEGRAQHMVGGEVFVMKTARGYALVLSHDFSLDQSQSPVLGFGANGQFAQETRISPLRSNSGRQTYILPEGVTPSDFNEIYVWSDATSKAISVASLH